MHKLNFPLFMFYSTSISPSNREEENCRTREAKTVSCDVPHLPQTQICLMPALKSNLYHRCISVGKDIEKICLYFKNMHPYTTMRKFSVLH